MVDKRNPVLFWRADDLGADLLRGRFADFSYDAHTHDTACFALITEGAIRIRMRGGEFVARKGDLYAINADEIHAGWPVDPVGWSQRTIYVDLDVLRGKIDDADVKGPSPLGPRADHQGSRACQCVHGPSCAVGNRRTPA